MKPQAGSFYRAALGGLKHAEAHLGRDTADDVSQVVLSMDYMAEMLLKAVLLERGESIMAGAKRSISLPDALKRFGPNPHAPLVEVLRERRDSLQHFAHYSDRETVLELARGIRDFAKDLIGEEFDRDLDRELGIKPRAIRAPTKRGSLIEEAAELQRDATFGGSILAWAQGRVRQARLGIRVQRTDGTSEWLTPEEEFEYMPHTDGKLLAAYRQSGGVVVYDLASHERRILSETGGPGDIEDGVVAAQGLGIAGGLGGGVWLIPIDTGEPEQLSLEGDSPRLSGRRAVWPQVESEKLAIKMRRVEGGQIETLVPDGTHPALDGSLLAWTDHSARPRVWAMDIDSGEDLKVADEGIFPAVRGTLIAFLMHRGDLYDLVVFDFRERKFILRIEDAGFPSGRGPVLTDRWVVWEAGRDRGLGHLRYAELPATT